MMRILFQLMLPFAFVSLAFAQAEDERPNVVIFLADDAGWGDYSYNGNRQLQTPNIDTIARQGAVLDRFYVCPVCSPTRAELLTGRYHLRGGVVGVSTGQERLDLDETTIAEAFKAAGYATGAFGKWHNGSQWPYHPMARGFDEYYGHTSGHWGEYFDPELELNGKMIREEGYIVDLCTNRAIDFIERNRDRPFFCYVPFTTPHSPWAVPDEDWVRFKEKSITQFATQKEREDFDETRCALAMVENQDRNVGRVLEKLTQIGANDNTIVFYFSDNGPNSMRWNGGMKGKKGNTDEGGVRVPGFIRWPKRIAAGVQVPQIAGAIDLLPTLTSLAGIEPVGNKPLDGVDLSPLLLASASEASSVQWPERMIFTTWAGKTSVRTEQFRLDDKGQLYDMISDPGQTQHVSTEFPEVSEKLSSAVQQWTQEMRSESAKKQQAIAGDRSPARRDVRGRVDPRPIHVGFTEFPITILPARDGEPHGSISRSSSAPNSSYFVNWKTVDDAVIWSVEVQTPGRYEVSIDYTCPIPDAGSIIELSFQSAALRGTVEPGWDPPLYTNQDTLPRPPAESQMKPFRPLALGVIELPSGSGELTLKAIKIPGNSVMDLRRLTLTLVTE
jgi:arylsulfatase A-like enzyme